MAAEPGSAGAAATPRPSDTPAAAGRWKRWRHAHHAMRHSLKKRLVAMFVLLALLMSGAFLFGMQKALGLGWRDAARPLLADYLDRVTREIGSPPAVERAQALVERLPVTIHISGPVVNWDSHPDDEQRRWRREAWMDDDARRDGGMAAALSRMTADGHRIDYGLNLKPWRDRPRFIGWATLAVLLLMTALAYAYVRRLLRPLDDIRDGARRYGQGQFSEPIPVRRRDELGQLANDVNAMAGSIHQMLEAKRSLLLAISHELRSPLTRARLNTELLPEDEATRAQRDALLRDLALMRDLVTDLLESERLASRHAALNLEPTDIGALARDVVNEIGQGVSAQIEDGLPLARLDRIRIRLLLRNLLDNALRHSAESAQPPVLRVTQTQEGGQPLLHLCVRDHGPGVPEDVLPHLAEAFYRPDAARSRESGGVGLGLYLCRLVAQAHGGRLEVRNAQPGLEVCATVAMIAATADLQR